MSEDSDEFDPDVGDFEGINPYEEEPCEAGGNRAECEKMVADAGCLQSGHHEECNWEASKAGIIKPYKQLQSVGTLSARPQTFGV